MNKSHSAKGPLTLENENSRKVLVDREFKQNIDERNSKADFTSTIIFTIIVVVIVIIVAFINNSKPNPQPNANPYTSDCQFNSAEC
jgi:hypothetical protein